MSEHLRVPTVPRPTVAAAKATIDTWSDLPEYRRRDLKSALNLLQ